MKVKQMIAGVTVLLCLSLPLQARAVQVEESLWEAVDTKTLEEAAGESAFAPRDGFSLEEGLIVLSEDAAEQVEEALTRAVRSGGLMLLVVLFCGMGETLFQSGRTAMTRTADMIGVVAITLVAASDTASMIGLGKETIEAIDIFSKELIPTMSAAAIACGSITGATARQAATLFCSDLLITLISRVLIPVVYLYIAVTAATAAVPRAANILTAATAADSARAAKVIAYLADDLAIGDMEQTVSALKATMAQQPEKEGQEYELLFQSVVELQREIRTRKAAHKPIM